MERTFEWAAAPGLVLELTVEMDTAPLCDVDEAAASRRPVVTAWDVRRARVVRFDPDDFFGEGDRCERLERHIDDHVLGEAHDC